ncbi:hypothetical protein MKX01_037436, partial [Papaver californicum]
MATEDDHSVLDLIQKFKTATLELGESSEVIFHQTEEIDAEDDGQWDICLVGKFIIERKMSLKAVGKNINFSWPFLAEDEMQIFEIDTNIMVFKFKDWDTLSKVYETKPWSINGFLLMLHDYDSKVIYQELDWKNQVFWIRMKKLLPEHTNIESMKKI